MPVVLSKILGSKWTWIGIAIAAALAFMFWQRHEISSMRAERDQAVAERQIAETANDALSQALARSKRAAAASDAAISRASRKITEANKRVSLIMKRVDSLNDQTKCGPAVATVLDSLRQQRGSHDSGKLPAGSGSVDDGSGKASDTR